MGVDSVEAWVQRAWGLSLGILALGEVSEAPHEGCKFSCQILTVRDEKAKELPIPDCNAKNPWLSNGIYMNSPTRLERVARIIGHGSIDGRLSAIRHRNPMEGARTPLRRVSSSPCAQKPSPPCGLGALSSPGC